MWWANRASVRFRPKWLPNNEAWYDRKSCFRPGLGTSSCSKGLCVLLFRQMIPLSSTVRWCHSNRSSGHNPLTSVHVGKSPDEIHDDMGNESLAIAVGCDKSSSSIATQSSPEWIGIRSVSLELPVDSESKVWSTHSVTSMAGGQRQLAGVLLRYSDLFPVPGSTLTGHTDAVEHDIDMGDGSPIRCAPCRMSPQKMKKEEDVLLRCWPVVILSLVTALGLRRSC